MSILFITDAGLSAPSGISTYRGDTNSLYNDKEHMNLMDISSLYSENTRLKLSEHLNKWKDFISTKEPNKGHYIISDMIQKYGGLVITQNVDNLQEKTSMNNEDIFHLHGSLFEGYKTNYPEILDVVLFNEEVKEETLVQNMKIKETDVTVLVGTSLTVFSPLYYITDNTTVYIINRETKSIKEFLNSIYDGLTIYSIEKDVIEGLEEFKQIYDKV